MLVPAQAPNEAHQNGGVHRRASMSIKANTAWLSTMQAAIEHTVIISEILDPRTRHLIQAGWPICLATDTRLRRSHADR